MPRPRNPLRALLAAVPAAVLAAGLGAALVGCGSAVADVPPGKTAVVASFYPAAWLAERVGGGDVYVRTLTRPGAEPHDLELTARQVAQVEKADLAVYVKGVQPAVDDAVREHARNRSLDAASLVRTLPPPSDDESEIEEHDGDRGHADVGYDPHVWLDPARMATIATALGDRLAEADTAHATAYRQRAQTVAAQLTGLDQRFRDGLENCARRDIVTAHAAFGYLAERYGLRQVSIAGIDPSMEPSPKRLAGLTREVRAAGATTIFTERLVSSKVADSLAREAGVRTAVLDPVEGVEPGSSDDYLTVMDRDLRTLRPALGCS
ncbi:metal ABC transporter substrate-binding protein [Actinomadura opuntiae]|uniref:metal ABC transporter substrate-binding protein n=1 Tax=Actinomadura sp. OS1-43 TaxID=604315 RepID=UPI00255A99A2|nr:metal ABC transporter substrate-binding protein [Actinomadura sp. OS1-43]MDL4818032.1 metal ABC transporter substrate-binding protein [Actinomadura sp. OS1-43]